MTSRAEDQDHEAPIDPTDADDGVDEEVDDVPDVESRIFRFFDWLAEERNKEPRRVLIFLLIAIPALCCGLQFSKSIEDQATTWFVQTKSSLDGVLTDRQQIAALAALGALFAYRLWRAVQIRRGIKPLPWVLIMLTVCLALGFTLLATWLMFREASNAPKEAAAQLRFDAVKTGITLFAGTAGVGALVLSFRSHFNSETDRLNSQLDAAADKMSNSSKVVQTAGILSVERIALKHPSYRRSAIALLEAYTLSAEGYNKLESIRVLRRFGQRNWEWSAPPDETTSSPWP